MGLIGGAFSVIGAVIVSHGKLAVELLSSAETIVGKIDHMRAVSIGWYDDVDMARKQIADAIVSVDDGQGVLILTDMFGGTPTNLAMTFLDTHKVEVLTGVNLAMVIRVANQKPGETLKLLAKKTKEQGQNSIYLASEILNA
ncbi:MAG: hypothetical protein RMM17_10875 [Acidobacteriota bacterium]|nr:hypothetical protein [Blastocatellia bacterium]MDW8413175.1 hypothetical protein [Acidobacteriota bacterium]